MVIEFQQGFIKRCDEAQSEIIFRLLDFLDYTGVTGPLDILVPDGHQVVALSHPSDLNNRNIRELTGGGGGGVTHISQTAVLHPSNDYRGVSPHTEPEALVLLLTELNSPGRRPVVLG